MEKLEGKIAILGAGNIGASIADGIIESRISAPEDIFLTRKSISHLEKYKLSGCNTGTDNSEAVQNSSYIIIAVTPNQLNDLLTEIKPVIEPGRHIIISVVSGASVQSIKSYIGNAVKVVRVMPNTAIAIRESMTCISAAPGDESALEVTKNIFDLMGETLVIKEELMVPATALCACGIAFFFRAVRAASQGGIEIGFHAEDALFMAAQTAKGAASLLLTKGLHPESEVDKVTTPRGCTISGLNNMEHAGFSSALIKGILTSAEKAKDLYS